MESSGCSKFRGQVPAQNKLLHIVILSFALTGCSGFLANLAGELYAPGSRAKEDTKPKEAYTFASERERKDFENARMAKLLGKTPEQYKRMQERSNCHLVEHWSCCPLDNNGMDEKLFEVFMEEREELCDGKYYHLQLNPRVNDEWLIERARVRLEQTKAQSVTRTEPVD